LNYPNKTLNLTELNESHSEVWRNEIRLKTC
jgi:hypothetical protein